jgi:flavin-dependent dehydrogenase
VIHADVAVIGAGPAGAAATLRLVSLGVRDVVVVDRADFPRDKTCGSGLSPKGIAALKTLGVWDDVAAHAYPIRGLRLVTSRDRELYASGGETAAAVICPRRILDDRVLGRARARGTRFLPRFVANALCWDGGRVTGFTSRDGQQVHARFTVVADGGHSSFSPDPRPRRRLQAIMGWWHGVRFRPHHIEMIFDGTLVPGYGWLFPEDHTRVNIGICYEDPHHRRNGRRLFERFLSRHYAGRLHGAVQAGSFRGHPISYAFSLRRLTSPGRFTVGEAGDMVHPATAEGISQAMRSGMLAADAVADTLAGRLPESAARARYEAECRRAFGVSFGAARLWRAAIRTPLLDWVMAAADRPAARTALAGFMAKM